MASVNKSLTVSVCIPTFKRAHLAGDAIESALQQSISPREILVFDNCSEDGIDEVVRAIGSPLVKLFVHPRNIGMCANWNACLNAAEGDIVTLLHSDDRYADDTAIERAIEGFRRNPNAAVVYSCAAASTNTLGAPLTTYTTFTQGRQAAEHVYNRGQLPCSSTFYRNQCVRQTTGFSERFSVCCDEEFNSRMSLLGDVVFCSTTFAVYRRHTGHTMYDTWLRPEFLSQYVDSTVAMAMNAGLAAEAAQAEVRTRIMEILWASSWMAFRHGRADASRALHRCIWTLRPAEYLNARKAAHFALHHMPCGHLCWQGYVGVKRAVRAVMRTCYS